ncbi:MAG: hypothetical protein ACT4QG_19140 [Sporichthyaceae bacterium]
MIARRMVPLGVAAVLAGCAQSPDVVQGLQAPVSASPTPRTADELTVALELWKDFPADAAPRPLIVLHETRGGGFESGEAKAAFAYGDWAVPKDLPAAPSEFGGYRVLPAKEALVRLRGEQAEDKLKGAGDLTVETVKLVAKDFPTDRGEQSLPAWRVDFVQGSQPIFMLAVADSARYVPDPKTPYYPWAGATGRESDTALTLSSGGSIPGPCGGDNRIEVAESDNAVAYRIVPIERAPTPSEERTVCPAIAVSAPTTLTLQRPLGSRVLLAVSTDRIEPVGLSEPKSHAK